MNRDLANILQLILFGISSVAVWHVLTAETNRGVALTIQAVALFLGFVVYRVSRRSDR